MDVSLTLEARIVVLFFQEFGYHKPINIPRFSSWLVLTVYFLFDLVLVLKPHIGQKKNNKHTLRKRKDSKGKKRKILQNCCFLQKNHHPLVCHCQHKVLFYVSSLWSLLWDALSQPALQCVWACVFLCQGPCVALRQRSSSNLFPYFQGFIMGH